MSDVTGFPSNLAVNADPPNHERSDRLLASVKNMPMTSIDTTTLAGQRRAYNACTTADKQLADFVGRPLDIVDYIVFPGEMDDEETGGQKEIYRCTLIDSRGVSYGCASDGVIRSIGALQRLIRPAPWDPPLCVIMTEGLSNRNRRFYTLQLGEMAGE
jgi:hypothetical protein